MQNKYNKLSLFSLGLTFLCLLSINVNVYAAEKQSPSNVINDITIENLQNENVVKTENFTLDQVEYTRHYITEDNYYVTCVENGETQYYVNLLNVYPLVDFTETMIPDWVSKKYEGEKFVKMYYDGYEHFVLTYDLLDIQQINFLVDGKEYAVAKYNHFVKIEQ